MMCFERSSEPLVHHTYPAELLRSSRLQQEPPGMLLIHYLCQPYLLAWPVGMSYAIMPVCYSTRRSGSSIDRALFYGLVPSLDWHFRAVAVLSILLRLHMGNHQIKRQRNFQVNSPAMSECVQTAAAPVIR